jgi:hypothetical protein
MSVANLVHVLRARPTINVGCALGCTRLHQGKLADEVRKSQANQTPR